MNRQFRPDAERQRTRIARRVPAAHEQGSMALVVLLALTAGIPAAAQGVATDRPQEAERELLNSERIEQRFGNVGLEVLESDGAVRVSNLFSTHDGERVCRTFAVVRYPPAVDPRFAAEHRAILDGGSIGAVFAANGWSVLKRHLHYGEVAATPRTAALMGRAARERLAVHVYALDVAKDGAVLPYAIIAEIHHPSYLQSGDLAAIYGPPRPDADLVAAMLGLVRTKLDVPP